ncbi:hypothetical protein MCUN1_001803 [Malassezia cuniculi]|uniref:Eukaryotic translation initiation factor 2A n=1 Tax=Malassezia cuniculi TaxID=948313 RepID=A0AAF0EYE0_9BASI|nr:hypothetical protein MCUN1_001803 [Malassezia cuniculi]
MQWAYRAQKRVGVNADEPEFAPVSGFDGSVAGSRMVQYSPDGRYFAVAADGSTRIYDASTLALLHDLAIEKAIEIAFSPRGTYLSTWERPVRTETPNGAVYNKNLRVWRTSDGVLTGEFERRQIEGCFPQFTADEKYALRLAGAELHVFDPTRFDAGPIGRVRQENMASFSVSPGERPSVAVFFPEKKGAPAMVRIYTVSSMIDTPGTAAHVAQKSFFKAEKVTFKWNASGTSLLLLTATDHDKTGKSYYGETNLYMLSSRGDFDCRVNLDKEGPIHDFEWNPNSREFIVIYGYMPAKAVLFSYRVNVIAELGTQPRNFIAFNPQGRLFCLAGFGNLAGTVDIWDRESIDKGKLFTLNASNSSVLQWSPDGQYILTGTLSPRLRVENGVRIWHCTGSLVHIDMIEELYQVTWRPSAKVPPFPQRIPAAPTASTAAAAAIAKQASARPVGAYRPPAARGSSTTSVTEALRRDDTPSPAYVAPGNRAGGRAKRVPGAPERSSANKKNERPKAAPVMGAADVGGSGDGAIEKKVRNLNKKLKAIEQLKERRDRGETLEQTQLQKIDGEAELRRELAALEA